MKGGLQATFSKPANGRRGRRRAEAHPTRSSAPVERSDDFVGFLVDPAHGRISRIGVDLLQAGISARLIDAFVPFLKLPGRAQARLGEAIPAPLALLMAPDA